jgi:hypothetical protein
VAETLSPLDLVHVASPCQADWKSMAGDDHSRLCGLCDKQVYNIAAMTAEAALTLIREHEGSVCIRLYRRADGTVLTSDCPTQARATSRRVTQVAAAVLLAIAISLGGVMLPNLLSRASSNSRLGRGPVMQKVVAVWSDLLAWIGLPRRTTTIMGKYAVPVPPARDVESTP